MEWQPIETAPKGENILVIIDGLHPETGEPFAPAIARIDDAGWVSSWSDPDDYPRDNYTDLLDGAETWDDIFGQVHLRDWKLTHWPPLPEPPKDNGK